MAYHVGKDEFGQLVERALEELPEEFARFLEEVPVEVMDRPSPGQLRAAQVPPGSTLLGLYRGRPRTKRHVEDSGGLPDVIYIFQEPLERICHTDNELIEQVRRTVLHEIGHHFGMNEQDLKDLGYG